MEGKKIIEIAKKVINDQLVYRLEHLKKEHNIFTDEDLSCLVKEYYSLKGQIESLEEFIEYMEEKYSSQPLEL